MEDSGEARTILETIEEPLKSPWRSTKKDSKGSSTSWTIPRVPLPRFRGKPWEEEGGVVTLKSTFYCLGKVQNCRGYRLVGASRSTSSALEKVLAELQSMLLGASVRGGFS